MCCKIQCRGAPPGRRRNFQSPAAVPLTCCKIQTCLPCSQLFVDGPDIRHYFLCLKRRAVGAALLNVTMVYRCVTCNPCITACQEQPDLLSLMSRWSIDVLFSSHACITAYHFSVNYFKPSQRPWDVYGQLEFVCPRRPQRHIFRMLDNGPYHYLISTLGGSSLWYHFSVNSFKPSQRPWDVYGQLEFVCPRCPQRHIFRMLDNGSYRYLISTLGGSSLYIVRTSPASPCRPLLFLSPRKSHTIGGPSTIAARRMPAPAPDPTPAAAEIFRVPPPFRWRSWLVVLFVLIFTVPNKEASNS